MVFSNSWWIAAVSRLIKCNYGRPHSSPLCGEKSPNFPIYGGFSSSREKCHIMLKFEKFTLKRRNKTSFKRDFTRRIIEGSNPSLSAIFILNKKSRHKAKSKFASKTCNLLFFLYARCAYAEKSAKACDFFKGCLALLATYGSAAQACCGLRPCIESLAPCRAGALCEGGSAIFFAKKNGERRRTCHGVASRAKTEVFSSRFCVNKSSSLKRRSLFFLATA